MTRIKKADWSNSSSLSLESSASPNQTIELSIVMPCLNEAETLETCIRKAQSYLEQNLVSGEVIVADNGSTDGSQQIAIACGAKLIHVEEKGYGSALMAGINAAAGPYIVMGDADDSYDFLGLNPFLQELRAGYDLVMGNRFKGGIQKNAMPFLNRYLGNPVLTGIGKLLFPNPCGDFHCGLRGFRKDAINSLDLRTTGMEFASEMVVKAVISKLRVTEVPTTLSPDGRSRPPHLRPWRDGWRHLRFLLLYSPNWLFLYPGLILSALACVTTFVLLQGPKWVFDIHTLLFASASGVVGFQAIIFAVLTNQFAVSEGLLMPRKRLFRNISKCFNLELGLLIGGGLIALSLLMSAYSFLIWQQSSFGPLEPSRVMRIVIPSATFLILGFQIIFASFFMSILSLRRK
ncbi:glycosyl transferase [Leptolyngbya sp. PCC 7375]|nr:glycosyl transferase [Leptolyngbya sp. PCC 7375]